MGINAYEKNISKYYIVGFVDSSFNVDDNCPHNLIPCGIAGEAKQIEDVQQYVKVVYEYKLMNYYLLVIYVIYFRINLMRHCRCI